MNEVLTFLKNCGTYYLATNEADQPHVRPFGGLSEYEGKLYIPTNNQKNVYQQMMKNSKFEISGMFEERWIRIEGDVKLDDRREARVSMMEQNPDLSGMYNVDDNLMVVFQITHATATIYSFAGEPEVYQI